MFEYIWNRFQLFLFTTHIIIITIIIINNKLKYLNISYNMNNLYLPHIIINAMYGDILKNALQDALQVFTLVVNYSFK